MGTELLARGVPTPVPVWSAAALQSAPEVVARIHADYAAAGATIHTTNTFRTKRRTFPETWETLARRAVELARSAVPSGHRVAGSISPLEDCYSPEMSPEDPRPEHRELARVLDDAGCDLLLCETFPHLGEGLIAVEEAVATGTETWAAFTPGPDGRLLAPAALARGAVEAVRRGATAVLVNCVAASMTLPYVQALSDLAVPFGAYANAGSPAEGMGWEAAPEAPERYLELVSPWIEAGASIVGACCGLRPAVVASLAREYGRNHPG